MKAVVIEGYGTPNVLVPADLPEPVPGPGEALVRIRAVAINPADAKWRAGMFAGFVPVTFPHVLGYDIAGEVIGGDRWAIGTRVFGMLDPIAKGGYAEMVAVADAQLAQLPDGLDPIVAAAIPTAGLTGLQMIEDMLAVTAGARILVSGAAGAVGRFAMHAAKARGATVVAAVRDTQVDEARRLGAEEVLVLGGEVGAVAPFDHVVDTVGGAIVAPLCRRLRPGGRIVTAATTPIPLDGSAARAEPFTVRPDGAQLARLAAMIAGDAIALPIAQVLPLDQAAQAHRLIERGGIGGKIVLQP